MNDDDLDDAVDGLYAYETGSVDSGIHDPGLRQRLIDYLRDIDDDFDFEVAALEVTCRLYLTPFARQQGYSEEDAVGVIAWMRDLRGSPRNAKQRPPR